MAERKSTEEGKASSNLYALNPISRRYVLKTSDVYLRLLKSGVVSDPETMEALDLRKREASRARQRGAALAAAAATAMAHQVNPEPVAPKPEPKPVAPKKPDRAEVRRRVVQVALDNQSELDGCQDDDELEDRLRRLLAPSAKPRRATHARHRACAESDEETSDY
jgi:hypothetical protein